MRHVQLNSGSERGKVMVKNMRGATTALLVAFLLMGNACSTFQAAEQDQQITVLTPPVHKDRVMNEVADAFNATSGIEVNLRRPHKKGRPWSVNTRRVISKDRVLFTSKEDWTYRADEEDKEKLRYTPFARQLVHRCGNEVGYVEYGFVVPQENVQEPIQTFLEWSKTAEAQAILEKPDPYYYVSLDREVVEFEPPEWFAKKLPSEGDRPSMWYGISHIWGNEYYSTLLAELKMMWMAGFNHATGVTWGGTEPFRNWAEDHNFILAGSTVGEGDLVEKIRKTSKSPALLGLYYQNEDFLSRVYYPLYSNVHQLKSGKTKKEMKGVKAVRDQFPRWLKKEHGDLKTLNRRWGTSYDSWDEIGFPELPLDWVQRLYRESGAVTEDLEVGALTKTFFHQPLHFHALADHPELLDFQRYMREAWARKYKAFDPNHGPDQLWDEEFTNKAEKIQPYLGPGKFYYTTKTRMNPYLFREVPEFNSAGFTHMITTLPPHFYQVLVDSQAIVKNKPLWNAEHHLYNHGSATPRMVRYSLLRNYLLGLQRSSSYNRQTNFMSGRPDAHGHYKSAQRGEHYRGHVKSIVQIRRNESVFRAFLDARADADIAVLVTEGNRGWNTLPDDPARPEMGGAVKAYGHVAALGRPWRYVLDRDVSASRCTDVLIVDAPWLTEDTAEKLLELPEDRRIIAVGQVPTENPYGETLPQAEELKERTATIDSWNGLSKVVEPAEGLSGPYTEVSNGDFWFWGSVAGTSKYSIPVPRLEVRHVRHQDKLYVAVINHSSDREVTATLPWAGGRKIRELTAENAQERIYPEGEALAFPPYSVRVFEIPDGKIPVTFWEYGGRDPNKANPMGKNIEDAFRNHNMGVNNHWNTAQPRKRGEEAAWSIWKVTPESSSRKISALTVSSELTAKKGKASGIFATVQWSLDPEGPWKSVYSHSFPGNTDSWMRKGNEGDIVLDEPTSTVYLRMKFPQRGRHLMWWDWKVVGRTVGADK